MSTIQDRLAAAIDGEVLSPGSERFEAERRSWHLGIDPRPALVVMAAAPGDVAAAVSAARAHGMPLAVQATGHGTLAPADGALLLKTSRLRDVHVDPQRRTARVGAGALWSDVVEASAPSGLAPVSGMTASVGVVGYTLGGGAGWLSRSHGFAADNVLRAEVVTADGETVRANADENPDLFWALRGGGPGFGVVTELEFRLHPVSQVFAGISMHPVEHARAALVCYREWALAEPEELNTAVMLMAMPDMPAVPEPLRGRRVLAIRAFYLGGEAQARRALAPLLEAAGAPLTDSMRTMSYAETPAITGPPPPPMAARQQFELLHAVPDGLIDAVIDAAAEPSPLGAVELRHWGGAMARRAPGDGPAGHRDVPFSLTTAAPFDPAGDRERVDGFMHALADRVRPFATGGSFLNFLTDTARTATAFTAENRRRLVEIRRAWDPEDVFRLGHAIRWDALVAAEASR